MVNFIEVVRAFAMATIAYNALRGLYHAAVGMGDVAIYNMILMEITIRLLKTFDRHTFGPES